MSLYSIELLDLLEGLAERNMEVLKGYLKASENAKMPQLKSFFKRKHEERHQFINNFINIVPFTHVIDTDCNGFITESTQNTWMENELWFTSDHDKSLLRDAIKVDKAAFVEYNELLDNNLLPSVDFANLIITQRTQIAKDIMEMKQLEEHL